MNFANKILTHLNVPLAEPVIRHGEEVLISNPADNIEHIENKIKGKKDACEDIKLRDELILVKNKLQEKTNENK